MYECMHTSMVKVAAIFLFRFGPLLYRNILVTHKVPPTSSAPALLRWEGKEKSPKTNRITNSDTNFVCEEKHGKQFVVIILSYRELISRQDGNFKGKRLRPFLCKLICVCGGGGWLEGKGNRGMGKIN